jgi:hypothetical protein
MRYGSGALRLLRITRALLILPIPALGRRKA